MQYPSYLSLTKKELKKRIEKAFSLLKNCRVCPRRCGVDRTKNKKSFCGLGYLPTVSAFHPHFGEEKVLVGKGGSGTIFFTGCNLSCVYCQNYEISQLKMGKEISFERLAEIMLELQAMGCQNINLVTPTPQVPQILKALFLAIEKGLKIPLVYNTNSYDSLEVLKLLKGVVDIYLPDVKYSDNKIAILYSQASNYFEIMKSAIKEMFSQVGELKILSGVAIRGLIVRHLVLPEGLAGSQKIFKFLAKEISKKVFLNIMAQYWPAFKAEKYPELSRRVTEEEYKKTVSLARKIGLSNLYLDQ